MDSETRLEKVTTECVAHHAATAGRVDPQRGEKMTRTRLKRTVVLLLCIGFSSFWASALRDATPGPIRAIDFGSMYYAARCAMERRDPYLFLGRCMAEGGFPPGAKYAERVGPGAGWTEVYPPTALLVFVPFAALPYPVAQLLWTLLTAGLLVLAGLAMWDLAGSTPAVSGCLVSLVLLNCEVALTVGNPGVFVAPCCVVAAWCLFKERYATAGVVLFTLCLVTKPQIPGFVWLYFFVAGGTRRKHALQILALAAVMGVCAATWIAPISPHWVGEILTNFAGQSVRGGPADPGPMGSSYTSSGPIVALQTPVSLIKDNPHFYNPVAYLVIGGLIAAWIVAVLRKRPDKDGALLALAAISVLTLLPMYHRTHDAKLLLLTIPGCAVLWAAGRLKRWTALALTATALFVTGDIPNLVVAKSFHLSPNSVSTAAGKLMMLLTHPAPLVLLATGCFYLWVYIRYAPPVPTGETTAEVVRVTEATV